MLKLSPRLVIIDMQRAFRDETQWRIPRYDNIVPVISDLIESTSTPPIATRFIRDPAERGTWHNYYDYWHQMRLAPDDNQWEITLSLPDNASVIDKPTFGKWGPELARLIPEGHEMLLTGVATDCCVLATAIAAVDAGRSVTVVSDACAAVSDEVQDQTLAILGLLSPMCRIVKASELG
ncbi:MULTISPECIES: cysteine hydrolase family protein [Micrococcaceae]|uniref:cysteine hydrolase family protein n=1 Tax=unclassified Kocuria TaxID=2649579 RepID=UPI001010AD8F|nr:MULTISPECIES: cysteine hydrolase [unclassified Kocuria]